MEILKTLQKFRLPHWDRLEVKPEAIAPLTIGLASLLSTGLVLSVKHIGGLQQLELMTYDVMQRQRPAPVADPRILVIGVTERDIQIYQQSTLSDQLVANAIQTLQKGKPRVIGLDIYRDIPQGEGWANLLKELKAPNVVSISNLDWLDSNVNPETGTITLPHCKSNGEVGEVNVDSQAVPPPPCVPVSRIGFNDGLLLDPDNIVRRYYLYGAKDQVGFHSFSLQLALLFLSTPSEPARLGVEPDRLKLGNAIFPSPRASSGGYQTILDTPYQMLMDYRQSIRQFSLQELLSGQIPPHLIQDKVVMIGYTAESKKDLFPTPYSVVTPNHAEDGSNQSGLSAGVVLHAQALSQILGVVLDGHQLFWFWSEAGEAAWIFGWAAIAGILAWKLHHPLLLVPGLMSFWVILGGTSFVIFLTHGWVPVVAPIFASILSGSGLITYRTQQALRQQQMAIRLLGQSTAPEVAAALWKSRDRLLKSGKLPGQKLTATMLFLDIQGFSTISERLSPELVMDWLNECLTTIVQEVQTHRGIVSKFTGDGLMAVFGVPVARTLESEIAADAQAAVACALGISDRLDLLNQGWQQRDLPPVKMRIGIFTGPVVAGSLGGKDRMEYGVIGDSVNIASRLESCEKDRQPTPCRILIAKETLVYLQDKFIVESWGPLALKGKHHLVEVYRILPNRCDLANHTNPPTNTANPSNSSNVTLGAP